MEQRILHLQRAIAQNLVQMGKMTAEQAESMAPSEAISSIVSDLFRIAKDDEAVSAAVAKHLNRRLFTKPEVGVDLVWGEQDEEWLIYGDTIYLANVLDQRQVDRALTSARTRGSKAESIGVISASKLEALKASNGAFDNDDVPKDDELERKIELLIKEAASLDASDIHLQPMLGGDVSIRMRVDGDLFPKAKYPIALHDPLIRVLIQQKCGITLSSNTPQDGKFDVQISNQKKVGLRVSTLPVVTGSEKALKTVIRLLGNNLALVNLERLGLSAKTIDTLRRLGQCPNGLIVLTGPTGHGKTTTLHAVLMDIQGRSPNQNIHTIEDPVEFQHENIGHTEISPTVSFAQALRAILRQDPDVILVGEIRDQETAELAFQAGQTGHLVLTTLHTNNSHQSLTRLERLRVTPDLVASGVRAFLAQRLVKKLCVYCRDEYLFRSDQARFARYGSNRVFQGDGELRLYRAKPEGCDHCNTDRRRSGGMKGRVAVIEILEVGPDVQRAILDGIPPGDLRRSQIKSGSFDDLWIDGLRLVKEGIIGFEQLESTLDAYNLEHSDPVAMHLVPQINSDGQQPVAKL
ncbi:TPA: Flp pilus assembly complex ATPase component TadA [Pseudomonas aeruginosa]|nr:Flp pilus assembly complex ATPase component TadA [Pseudomonas aeruginosa]